LNVRAVIQAYDRIKASGGQVVAILPEIQEFTEKFNPTLTPQFPFLTDLDNATRIAESRDLAGNRNTATAVL